MQIKGVNTDKYACVVVPGDASNDTGQADRLRAKLRAAGYAKRGTASVHGYPDGTEVFIRKRIVVDLEDA